MENITQISFATATVLCAVLCGVSILLLGIGYVLLRSRRPGSWFGLRDAMYGGDENSATAGGVVRHRSRRSGAVGRAADIRARYDREFDAQVGGESGKRAGAIHLEPESGSGFEERRGSDDDKARYKRRFRQENPDAEDELDSFLDDWQL
jgi:hypothetical protein